ncbi:cytochrome c biogenesis protein CcdA [Deinococcus sp. YIM 77859]|uniref:cytochrome c biogenesis protein CcdA n=1 Tax=Deinococcus sp. YIM 77859 TaxID=1540221 RepID=UPI00068E77DD|nr:cytochrome c biogenesis protein CcdA [Deinococcus sp. YIM 77859]
MIALLTYAFMAGTVAALNPCGFAMLPAVISRFVTRPTGRTPLLDGLALGVLLTLGTLTTFSVLGLVISVFGTGLARIVPYLNLVLGVLLLVLAVRTFTGRALALHVPGLRAPEGKRLSEYYPYGVAYGMASLGCTLPVFLMIVGSSASRTPLERMGMFTAYGAGMGAVLLTVSLASAFGKEAVIRGLRNAGRYVDFVGGVGLLLAGAYMVYSQTRFIEQFVTGNTTFLPYVIGLAALLITAVTARVLYARELNVTHAPGGEA